MRSTRLAEFTALALLVAAALIPMIAQVTYYDEELAMEQTWSPVMEAGHVSPVCLMS